MKKFIFLLLFPILSFAQSDSLDIFYQEVDERYNSTYEFYKEFIQPDISIDKRISALEKFKPTYEKILRLDSYNNKNIQKALISDYADEYGDIFVHITNNTKQSFLFNSFDNKSDVYKYIEKVTYILKMDIHNRMLELIQKDYEKTQIFIDKNLKRLDISRQDYDNMSENDRDTLWEIFK